MNEPLWRPFRIALMDSRHVRGDRAVPALEGKTPMAGHAFPLMEEFHDLRTQTYVELLLDQRIEHRVVVTFDVHVVVNIDPNVFPLGIFIGLDRERSENGTVKRLKKLLAGAREFFEG